MFSFLSLEMDDIFSELVVLNAPHSLILHVFQQLQVYMLFSQITSYMT